MIKKILPLQFIAKSPFYGSCKKMRYRLIKQEDKLNVCIYPGPFGFEATPDDKKQFFDFAFSEEGYEEALALLNRKYEEIDWEKEELPFFETDL